MDYDATCVICFEDCVNAKVIRLSCKHEFHLSCFRKYCEAVENVSFLSCPTCRRRIWQQKGTECCNSFHEAIEKDHAHCFDACFELHELSSYFPDCVQADIVGVSTYYMCLLQIFRFDSLWFLKRFVEQAGKKPLLENYEFRKDEVNALGSASRQDARQCLQWLIENVEFEEVDFSKACALAISYHHEFALRRLLETNKVDLSFTFNDEDLFEIALVRGNAHSLRIITEYAEKRGCYDYRAHCTDSVILKMLQSQSDTMRMECFSQMLKWSKLERPGAILFEGLYSQLHENMILEFLSRHPPVTEEGKSNALTSAVESGTLIAMQILLDMGAKANADCVMASCMNNRLCKFFDICVASYKKHHPNKKITVSDAKHELNIIFDNETSVEMAKKIIRANVFDFKGANMEKVFSNDKIGTAVKIYLINQKSIWTNTATDTLFEAFYRNDTVLYSDFLKVLYARGFINPKYAFENVQLDARSYCKLLVSGANARQKKSIVSKLLRSAIDPRDNSIFRDRDAKNVHHTEQILIELFKNSPDLMHYRDERGFLPIHCAVKNNLVDLLHYLIENGVDIEARSFSGHTSLHYAEFEDIIEFLLANGADVTSCSKDGQSIFLSWIEKAYDDDYVFRTMLQFLPSRVVKQELNRKVNHVPVFFSLMRHEKLYKFYDYCVRQGWISFEKMPGDDQRILFKYLVGGGLVKELIYALENGLKIEHLVPLDLFFCSSDVNATNETPAKACLEVLVDHGANFKTRDVFLSMCTHMKASYLFYVLAIPLPDYRSTMGALKRSMEQKKYPVVQYIHSNLERDAKSAYHQSSLKLKVLAFFEQEESKLNERKIPTICSRQ